MTCSLDGGLWPLFWMTLAICVTIYAIKVDKGRKP